MALESDIIGSDSRLHVTFYKKAVENPAKTIEEGRPIYEDRVFVRIAVPGDNLSVIDTFANAEHQRRFPMHWQHFLNKNVDDDSIVGTPLKAWALITPAQAEELRGMKFYTVEQVANAADNHIMKLGMMLGMSPYSFRDKAKAYLSSAKDAAESVKRDEELQALKEQNEKIKAEADAKLAKMQEQLETLMSVMTEKKKGRAKKAETSSEVE